MGGRSDVREALPLETRSRVAIGALVLVIVADLVGLVGDVQLHSIASRIADGERVPFSDVDSVDSFLRATGLTQLVLLLLTAVVFLLWLSRAYRNAIAMGIRNPRYGTRWAIGCWFVPFVNLVVPKNVSNDVWRGSDPEMAYGDPAFMKRPVAAFIHWWWGIWLLSGLLSRIAANSNYDARNADELRASASLFFAADALSIAAAALAILFVARATARSEERRRRFAYNQAGVAEAGIGSLPPPPPPPPAPSTSHPPPPVSSTSQPPPPAPPA